MQNSFSMKANRLSTRKRDSRMSHRDVLTAGEQESSKGTTITEAAEEASVTGGNQEESSGSPF
jgi:hypothetical protein